jgi:hypothetical protein
MFVTNVNWLILSEIVVLISKNYMKNIKYSAVKV